MKRARAIKGEGAKDGDVGVLAGTSDYIVNTIQTPCIDIVAS